MNALPLNPDSEIISRFKNAITGGRHWYLALIEAMRDYPQDDYIIAREALDWISLGRAIIGEAADLINQEEVERFFILGHPPLKLSPPEARRMIGEARYNLYLNYLYGITIEASLVKSVVSEIEKEACSLGLAKPKNALAKAYLRIYGNDQNQLLADFKNDTASYEHSKDEHNQDEFTYWLFKYRLKNSDKEKVASDTKKAVTWLRNRNNLFPRLF